MLAGALGGAVGAFIYAFLTIELRANQTVTGLALSIFGAGFSSFMGKTLGGMSVPMSVRQFFNPVFIPILRDIPLLGQVFFNQDIYVYLGYICAIVMGIYLYKTRGGLILRAVGEDPATADAAGVNISLYKYVHTLIGGALCGLGGAYLSLVYVPTWQENIVAGRGWIAVALVIFSTWNPIKAIAGAFIFGGLDIIGFRLQGTQFAVNQYIIDMLPYLVTIFVLVFVSMKKSKDNSPPKGLGVPYFREER